LPLVDEHEGDLDLAALGPELRDRRLALGYKDFVQASDAYSKVIGDAIYRAQISKAERGEASPKMTRLIMTALSLLERERNQAPPEMATGSITIELHNVRGVEDARMTFDGNTPPEVMKTYVRALMSGLGAPDDDTTQQGDTPEDQT